MKGKVIILFLSIAAKTLGQEVTILSPALNAYHNIRDFCYSSETGEAFFSIQSPNQELSQIAVVKNQTWNSPELLPFCDGYTYLEPFLSKDQNRLYFASDRPKNENETVKSDFDIWYVERENKYADWSKPINIGPPVNTVNDEFYPTLADNGNLYFTMDAASGMGKDDIYYCAWDGSAYSQPVLLNGSVNSKGHEFNAFIAGDESFIIFTKYNAEDGFGSGDLYVSRKSENGTWGPAENLGNRINSKYMEYCPFYDHKTNTLYFTSRRSDLSPQKFRDIRSYQETISGANNGLSKIYTCTIKM